MIHFAQADFLLLLLLIPFFFVFYALMQYFQRQRIKKFGDTSLVLQLMPSRSVAKGWVKMVLFSLAFFFFSIGLARPQIGAKGMVYARVEADGNVKSSVDKFYSQEVLQQMKEAFGAKPGDLILILSGDDVMKTRKQLCELRLEVAEQLGLRDKNKFACLWIVDFPLFEWSEEDQRFYAMHHPFTSPKPEDIPLLDSDTGAVRANAYDMVINGVEVGGGSIRIHDSQLQNKMFKLLGFTDEMAQERFGFLMNAFKYGAPPHGGLAYGLDRWVSLFAGLDSIRDCIAFPKNNSGRDVMLDAPGVLDDSQLEELCLKIDIKE
jgi:aspartyl-tRNA synthetase